MFQFHKNLNGTLPINRITIFKLLRKVLLRSYKRKQIENAAESFKIPTDLFHCLNTISIHWISIFTKINAIEALELTKIFRSFVRVSNQISAKKKEKSRFRRFYKVHAHKPVDWLDILND